MKDGLRKIFHVQEKMEKSMGAVNAVLKANSALEKARPKGSLEFLKEQAFNFALNDTMSEYIKKQDQLNKIILGGSSISNIAQYVKLNDIAKLSGAWKDVSKVVVDNAQAYKAQLSFSKSLSSLIPENIFNRLDIEAGLFDSKFKPNDPTVFDLLSATTFANISEIHKSFPNKNIKNELSELQSTLSSDSDLRSEVASFATEVVSNEDDYQKVDEIATDFVHKLTNRFGLPKQYAHYLAVLIIFLLGLCTKETLFPRKSSQTNITIEQNLTIKEKTNLSIVLKDAPVYPSNRTSTRKLGILKEYAEVEILKVKDGWCYVKGEIEVVKKEERRKIKTDTLMSVWVMQKYIKDYKDK